MFMPQLQAGPWEHWDMPESKSNAFDACCARIHAPHHFYLTVFLETTLAVSEPVST
jgi:hypothetical protein